MTEAIDIHGTKKRFENAMKLLDMDKGISDKNREFIKKLIMIKSYAGYHTKTRHVYALRIVARNLKKDFNKVTNGELHKLFDDVSNGKIVRADGRQYKSVRHLKKSVKELYTIVIKRKRAIEGIKITFKLKDLSRNDFWTRQEILSFPDHAADLMDKALVSLLILGGNISEYGRLLVSDIEKSDDCLIVSIRNSKNRHRTRTLYMYENNVHIVNWIDSHPLKDSKEFPRVPLFVVKWEDAWKVPCYNFFAKHIEKIAKKVNIEKPANTHIFRNSVAFWKHQNGMHDLELNRSMGWALGSNMKARYIRCDDEGVRNEELRIRGLVKKQEKIKDEVIKCMRCQTKYTNIDLDKTPHCARCGFTMNPELREQEILRKQSDMELYSNVVALANGEKRNKLAELQTRVKFNDSNRDEIKNIVREVLRSENIGI